MKAGDKIRFRLFMGREVDGVVRAILKTRSGIQLRVEYGHSGQATLRTSRRT